MRAATHLRQTPRRFGLPRRLLFRGIEHLARLLGGRAFYRRSCLSPGRFGLRRERVQRSGLPPGLCGLRIAQLSDVHAGSFLGAGDLGAVVLAVNGAAPDLVVLTGDLITRHWEEALLVLEDLAQLRARLGVLAVFGNHDYHGRNERRIAAAYGQRGIRFLCNESVRFDTGRGALRVTGVEDLEEARDLDLTALHASMRPDEYEIVLCHNPRGAAALTRPETLAVLSGHTHGHQIDAPLVRKLAPAHPGDRRDVGQCAWIVNRGLGVIGFPLRWKSPAEVVLLELAEASP